MYQRGACVATVRVNHLDTDRDWLAGRIGVSFAPMPSAPSLVLFILLPMLAGCGPSATAGGFDSANPAAKLYAIEQAARVNDRSAIPRIVEQLESDDPAVRSLAISTLERMTGETYGYRDFDPPSVRQAAVQRWVNAVKSGSIPSAGASPAEADHG